MKIIVKRSLGEAGFSLVELVIVIAIVGVLVNIGIPVFQLALGRARQTGAVVGLASLNTLTAAYFAENGSVPDTSALTIPSGGVSSNEYQVLVGDDLVGCQPGHPASGCNCQNEFGFEISGCKNGRYVFLFRRWSPTVWVSYALANDKWGCGPMSAAFGDRWLIAGGPGAPPANSLCNTIPLALAKNPCAPNSDFAVWVGVGNCPTAAGP